MVEPLKFKRKVTLAIALGFFSFPMDIKAAQQPINTQTNTTTEVTAGGEDTETYPPIVSPFDPDDVIHQTGRLVISYASHFDFGVIKLTNDPIDQTPINTIVDESGQTVPVNYAVETNDTRGTGSGWSVNVSLTTFVNPTNQKILKGAQLVLPIGQVTAAAGIPVTAENTPLPLAVTLDADDQQAAKRLIIAGTSRGMGHWSEIWRPQQIHLKAPARQYKSSYRAQLIWTLVDGIT